jgi:thiol-disulfide isomerase/thioredoxin
MRWALAIFVCLASNVVSAQKPTSRTEQLEKLKAQKEETFTKFYEDTADAGDDLTKSIARYDGWPGWQFGTTFVEFAEAAPEDQAALAACRQALELCYAVGVSDRRSAATEERAWSLIEKYHLASPEVGELCILAGRYPSPRRTQFLETVLANGQGGRTVRALATYGLAEIRFSQYTICELEHLQKEHRHPFSAWVRENRTDPKVEDDLKVENCPRFAALASELYRTINSEYADVPAGEGGGSARGLKTLGDRASQRLFALEHLSIGAQAPEMEGFDLEGRPLKLSDFRGKVVLISFWFTGCGPCMGMLPQEKQLVEDLRGKPFQMLSVCNDPKVETGKATVSENGVTWPNWFDGAPWETEDVKSETTDSGSKTAGAISKQWNVRGWPTIYVLDEKGVIRAKHLRGEGLDAMVHRLVAAADKPK